MNNNIWTGLSEDTFSLDKALKKKYTDNNKLQTNTNAFNDEAIQDSALDYLYSDDNTAKTQSFLKNNGFPSSQERELNKELYGVQEERDNMRNLLKNKTNSILNPNLPDETDREFLKGLMGDKEGEQDYQNQLSTATRAQKDLHNAFKGTQFEVGLKSGLSAKMTSDEKKAVDIDSNMLEDSAFNAPKDEYDIEKYSNNKDFSSSIKTDDLSDPANTLAFGNFGTDTFKGIFNKAKQTYEELKYHTSEAQKEAQRAIWRKGAQLYLRDKEKCYTSAWMLEHSLQDNPSDIYRDNFSRIANLINNSNTYLKALDVAIKKSKNGIIKTDLEVIFDSSKEPDLYYSIHKATIHVNGYKQPNGKWIIQAEFSDKYNFTEFMTFMDDNGGLSTRAGVGTIANDVAAISQMLGAIKPYMVTVKFFTTR